MQGDPEILFKQIPVYNTACLIAGFTAVLKLDPSQLTWEQLLLSPDVLHTDLHELLKPVQLTLQSAPWRRKAACYFESWQEFSAQASQAV